MSYTTVQGDTWDKIAYNVYGNTKYMGNLLEANHAVLDTFVFDAGVTIETPTIDTSTASDTPIWRT